MNWNNGEWFGHKSNNKVKLSEPTIVDSAGSEDRALETNLSSKEFRNKLDELMVKIDRSGEIDLIAIKNLYRTWNREHLQEFGESDDIFLSLIDDFLSTCAVFESMEVARRPAKDRTKSSEMIRSIELQRELIKIVDESVDFDSNGSVVVKDEQAFSRTFATLEFLDNLSSLIIEKGGGSKEFMPKKYLSGLRSMVCAFCLAKGIGARVEFAEPEFDQKYDLDMVVVKDNKRISLDVTTIQRDDFNTAYGFQFFKEDKRSRIPDVVYHQLKLTSKAKLMLPSAFTGRGYYSGERGGIILGLPGRKMLEGFKRVF
ncbi:hypothetical protein A2572_04320 [Candidatus Collierbacteria bacterium RIFOXYD1_FULL_40_9]|uniref:Uncharacterized protein n=1 Tax=Candidatus Collierbacteria bacterium RIFOXYD1_FULL_40_9 TaxID=1817731 RepID=A0A1F5FPN8_9BACT|nr:MAG: hypothetical protein A2572_04320 [Candidatus Collierbacteria bacterium RIFOXYD1_FULL_40_9]